MTTESGSITVERVAALKDALRSYVIVIDGEERGGLKPGEKRTFEVAPGPHVVAARISWTGSGDVQVEVPPGGEIRLMVQLAGHPLNPWREFTSTKYLRLEAE